MQSGVTGINAVRIYSPIKQVLDQDPQGEFIRRYCPEVSQVSVEYIAEPHTMPMDVQRKSGCLIGKDYPPPVVEHQSAYREARSRMQAVKSTKAARKVAKKVLKKHGSRRRASQTQRKKA